MTVASTNLPSAGAIDELLGNATANGIKRSMRIPVASLAAQLAVSGAVSERINNLAAAQGAGLVYMLTWAALAAIVPAANTKGEVDLSDAGTHTDPVVGGTVPNSGVFRYSTSPAGWQRTGDNPVAALSNEVTDARGGASNLEGRLDTADTLQLSLLRRQRALQKSQAPRLRWTMDSMGQAGISVSPTGQYINSTAYSSASVVAELMPAFNNDTWFDDTSLTNFAGANNSRSGGQAGGAADPNLTADGAQWFDGVAIRPNDCDIFCLGLNDIRVGRAVADAMLNIKSLLRKSLAVSRHPPLLLTVRPVGLAPTSDTDWGVGSTKRLKLIDMHTQQLALASDPEFAGRIRVHDSWPALGSGTDIMDADLSYDGGFHLNTKGAQVEAQALVTYQLSRMFPNISVEQDWRLDNVFADGFTGTGGTAGTRVTAGAGGIPDGWTCAFVGGDSLFTATCGQTQSADGSYQVNITVSKNGGSGTARLSFYRYNEAVPTEFLSRHVKGLMEVERSADASYRAHQISIRMDDADDAVTASAGVPYNDGITQLDDPDVLPTGAKRVLPQTPPIIMPGDRLTCGFAFDLLVFGDCLTQLRRPQLAITEDPRPYRGYA